MISTSYNDSAAIKIVSSNTKTEIYKKSDNYENPIIEPDDGVWSLSDKNTHSISDEFNQLTKESLEKQNAPSQLKTGSRIEKGKNQQILQEDKKTYTENHKKRKNIAREL
jgi:hypothetical protein